MAVTTSRERQAWPLTLADDWQERLHACRHSEREDGQGMCQECSLSYRHLPRCTLGMAMQEGMLVCDVR